jgi:LysM repeat protein
MEALMMITTRVQIWFSAAGIASLFLLAGCQLSGAPPAPVTPFEPIVPTDVPPPTEDTSLPEPTQANPIDVFSTQTALAPTAEGGVIEEATPDGSGIIVTPTEPGGEVPGPETTPGDAAQPTVEGAATAVPGAATATPASPPATQAASTGQTCQHTVKAGETMYRIALQYGLTTNALAAANGITNPDRVSAGTVLTVPNCSGPGSGTGTTAGGSATDRIHVVKEGENLFRIALQYGLTYQQLATYNGITDPASIFVGQELRIPASS